VCKAVLLVLQGNTILLFLLLTAHVVIVILLAQPALEELILNARSVMAQLMLWLMEMSAEEYVVELLIGEHRIIVARFAIQLVLAVQDLLGISVSPASLALL
jgi:hypothetical protein